MGKTVSGFRAKRLFALVFLLTLTGAAWLFAADNPITFTPPVLHGSDPSLPAIQTEINRIIKQQETLFRNEFQGLTSDPQKMIGAFASSSVFSSTGASLRTYQGYDTFALTLGFMGGVQLPVDVFSMFSGGEDVMNKIYNDFTNNGDIPFGVNPQIINVQAGINTSKFLLNGLYFGFKAGFMSLPLDLGDFSTSFLTWSAGVMANYQILRQWRVGGGLFVWRGLNIGAGLIYQRTNLKLNVPLELESDDYIYIPSYSVSVRIADPELRMNFLVNTITIPLEAVTAIRLLGFFNISLGAGADVGFGSANLNTDGHADIRLYGLPAGTSVTDGSITISMGGENTPSLLNPKAMASLGISLGPVILLDIPVTYYFLNYGYNIGLSLGFTL